MRSSQPVKARRTLERTVAKYEAKLARAANPSQKRYAAGVLRMARAALADGEAPADVEPAPDDVVDLLPHEYREI